MIDLDLIFGELESGENRFEQLRLYISRVLPGRGEALLVSTDGDLRWGGLEMDPEVEKDLLARARESGGVETDREKAGICALYSRWARACLFLAADSRVLVRALLDQLVRGFDLSRKAEEQEALIHTRNRQFAREKEILESRNREILGRNFTQHEKYARMLESEIKRQTRDLVAARKTAESASRSKSEFLASMSHEIRTPMNGVIGMLEILSETRLTRDQQSYVESTRQSAHSLLTIINDILDFSKVEAGKLDIEQINFNLALTLDSVLDLMVSRAGAKGIDLAMQVDPDVPLHLIGDPSRVRQVLVNLVENAIKFTDQGHVLIRVSCRENTGSDCFLLFEVLDTGVGIPREMITGVFNRFSQADRSTTRKFGGTGLGLAISRQLSLLMGGEIGVESDPGKGSCFWFTIRVRQGAGCQKASRFPEMSPLRVLVADQVEVHREVIQACLREFGSYPVPAADAGQALKALDQAAQEKRPFDVLLIDERISGPDGELLCKELPARFKETTPVLMLSDHRPGVREKYRSCASYFLFKPVKKKELFLTLRLASGAPVPCTRKEGGDPPAPSSPARPLTILLVEDNPVNQRVATLMLKGAGHQVIPAGDGQEALDIYQDRDLDLILMDIQMPVMDGETACRKIRELEPEGRARVPIVALTANAMKGDRERYLGLGMDDYLAKPIRKDVLLKTVHRLTS